MKIIVPYKLVSIDWLKLGKSYQRNLETLRLKKVGTSMSKYGFLPNCGVMATEDGGIVEGQHRYMEAKRLGIKEIPVTILRFESLEEEARFFEENNSYSTNLKCTDLFHAAFVAKDIAALIIYELEEDPNSLLCGRIALKDKEAGSHDKFSLGAVVSLINTTVFNLHALHWKKNMHEKFAAELEKKGYEHVLSRVNLFLTWFYRFAPTRKENPLAYKLAAFRAVLRVYSALEKEGFLSTPAKWAKTVEQMKKFDFSEAAFNKSEWTGRAVLIRMHINKGRTQKLEM